MEFVELKSFERDFNRSGMTDDDLRKIQLEIIKNPNVGDVEIGVKGLRKMRFSSTNNKGKSGGSRVHYIIIKDVCYLIAFVPKNVAENLSKSERNDLAKFISGLKESFIYRKDVSMKNKTYYDYIKEGLQDLQDYLNGDLSKGRKCTMTVEEPSFVESTSSEIKLKIKESDDKVNTREG